MRIQSNGRQQTQNAPQGTCLSRTQSTNKSVKEVNEELRETRNDPTYLSASTVTNNYELPADFSHVERKFGSWRVMVECSLGDDVDR